jgi:hypothetical protein
MNTPHADDAYDESRDGPWAPYTQPIGADGWQAGRKVCVFELVGSVKVYLKPRQFDSKVDTRVASGGHGRMMD